MELPAKLTRPQDLALKLADVMGRQITVSDALMQQLQRPWAAYFAQDVLQSTPGFSR